MPELGLSLKPEPADESVSDKLVREAENMDARSPVTMILAQDMAQFAKKRVSVQSNSYYILSCSRLLRCTSKY